MKKIKKREREKRERREGREGRQRVTAQRSLFVYPIISLLA